MLFAQVFVLCALNGANYPLKDISKALSEPNQSQNPSIIKASKKLLEETKGIINYQSAESSALRAKLANNSHLVVRILGDSHIAGDFLPQRLRNLLFNKHTFGFVYPLYPSYHQYIGLKYESNNIEILNSRLHTLDNYPLGGIVAKAQELPAHISLMPTNAPQNAISRFIFKAPSTDSALIIEDANNQKFAINAKKPNVWQIISLKLHYPVHIYPLNDKVLLGGMFIYEDNGQSNVVENLGINGARSDIWLKWDKALLQKQLSILPADLIVLCYGSNDALYDNFNAESFIKNYSDLIDIIRESNASSDILILSPPPIMQKVQAKKSKKSTYKVTKNAKPLKEALHKLAKDKQTMIFDMEDFINQSGGKAKWQEANLSKADVHLLPNGYKLIADKLYYELMKMVVGK